jgi:MraZ protein
VAELLGTHNYQLDPKGRLSLPARFREALADGVWVTIGQDGCLFAFPRVEWQRRADEVSASPLSDTAGRAYARLFFGSSDELRLDVQGRLTLPGRVRDRMEIWDRDSYERYEATFAGAYQSGTLEPGHAGH